MMIAERLHQIVRSRHPAYAVGVVRIMLGVVATIRGLEAIRILRRFLPDHILKIPWADWLPGPTGSSITVVLVLWVVSAVAFAAGFHTRAAGSVLAASMVLSVALDQQAYSNHLYLLIVLIILLTASGPGAALSFDAKRDGSDTVQGWPILLMKIQITVVYLFAGLTKVNDTFLSGIVLRGNLGSGFLSVPEFLVSNPFVRLLAVMVIATELAVALLLWNRRARPIAFALGIALHASIPLLMAPFVQLVVFSGEMLACYLLFLHTAEAPQPEPVANENWQEPAHPSVPTAANSLTG